MCSSDLDLPFYDPVIHEDAVQTMNAFAIALGLLTMKVAYDQVVATRFRDLWVAVDSTRRAP